MEKPCRGYYLVAEIRRVVLWPSKKIKAHCIGEVIKSGMFLIDEKGHKRKASIKGYQHFKI